MELHGEVRAKVFVGTESGGHAAPKKLFFDNEPLLSYFVGKTAQIHCQCYDGFPPSSTVSVKYNGKMSLERLANRKFGSMVITSAGMGFCVGTSVCCN